MTGHIYRPLVDDRSIDARTRSVTIIKWLRGHGERGVDFDWSGSGRTLSIWFANAAVEMLFILRWK